MATKNVRGPTIVTKNVRGPTIATKNVCGPTIATKNVRGPTIATKNVRGPTITTKHSCDYYIFTVYHWCIKFSCIAMNIIIIILFNKKNTISLILHNYQKLYHVKYGNAFRSHVLYKA